MFPKTEGNYRLTPLAVLDVESLITAADYNRELDLLALTGYNFRGKQFFYTVSDFKKNGWESFNLVKYDIPIKGAQVEAVKIVNTNNFILTSEQLKSQFARLIQLKIEK